MFDWAMPRCCAIESSVARVAVAVRPSTQRTPRRSRSTCWWGGREGEREREEGERGAREREREREREEGERGGRERERVEGGVRQRLGIHLTQELFSPCRDGGKMV